MYVQEGKQVDPGRSHPVDDDNREWAGRITHLQCYKVTHCFTFLQINLQTMPGPVTAGDIYSLATAEVVIDLTTASDCPLLVVVIEDDGDSSAPPPQVDDVSEAYAGDKALKDYRVRYLNKDLKMMKVPPALNSNWTWSTTSSEILAMSNFQTEAF